jgi:outer membrane protein assembly factor BamC
MKTSFVARLLLCVLTVLFVSGCETLVEGRKVSYKTVKPLPPLDMPPDLVTQPGTGNSGVPGTGTTTYSEFAAGQKFTPAAAADSGVLPEFSDIRLARDGAARWLIVKSTPEALWPRVHDFVLANGLLIARENPQTGIIETDWAENRAKVGSGGQLLLAKWLSTLYSTGTRDRFRVRLERGAQTGTTEVYLTHQGMEEVDNKGSVTGGEQGTLWRPRPTEPELEVEMMRLLMVHLGRSEVQAKAVLAGAETKSSERAKLNKGSTGATLSLQDDLDRAWRRIGLSLDRLGFTVEDRDRTKGVYYVRYIDPDTAGKKGGWFSGWFSKDEGKPKEQFQIHLKGASGGTDVEVLDKAGTPETSDTSNRILALLYEQLK